jgi:hypothetical protein
LRAPVSVRQHADLTLTVRPAPGEGTGATGSFQFSSGRRCLLPCANCGPTCDGDLANDWSPGWAPCGWGCIMQLSHGSQRSAAGAGIPVGSQDVMSVLRYAPLPTSYLCCLVASVFGWTCPCAGRRRFEILARLAKFSIGFHAWSILLFAGRRSVWRQVLCFFRSRPRFGTTP